MYASHICLFFSNFLIILKLIAFSALLSDLTLQTLLDILLIKIKIISWLFLWNAWVRHLLWWICILFLSNCSTTIAPCYLIWHLSLLHDWQTEKRSKFSHCECFIYTNTLYTRTYIALRVCFTHMRLGDCTHECHVYKPCLRL